MKAITQNPALHEAADLHSGLLRGIASAMRRAVNRIGDELTSRRHEQFLAALDDRMLADIGIARSEIAQVVRSDVRQRRMARDAA